MAYDFSKLKTNIKETEEWLVRELSGGRTPLRELGSVSTEDARTLRVIPWDKGLLKAIEKGITDADLGVGVSTDDQGLRVSFPELTSERRTQLSKIAGDRTEQAKVTLRSHRTDALKALEAAEEAGGMGEDEVKRLKGEIQKLIDEGNEALMKVFERKEEEIAQ